MKRYLAIFGILFIGVIAGLIVRGIPIVLQVNAGGGIQADRNGDVNGDARLDMSDAVYLLLHIFRDGPQPVALAQGSPELEEGINRTNQLLAEIANPCNDRNDRFINNSDGTVTDTCTGLMWFETTADVYPDGAILWSGTNDNGESMSDRLIWSDAAQYCQNIEFAGYNDWRLPTANEMEALKKSFEPQRPLDMSAIGPHTGHHWTSTEKKTTTRSNDNGQPVGPPHPRHVYVGSWMTNNVVFINDQSPATRNYVLPVRTAQ